MKRIILFLLFISMTSAYAMSGSAPEPELLLDIPEEKNQPVELTIDKIIKIDKLENQKVTIVGEFWGWSGVDGPPPFSMSDWVIRDPQAAIYVHGPMPEGCDTFDKSTYGKAIRITGIRKSKLVSRLGNVKRVIYIELE